MQAELERFEELIHSTKHLLAFPFPHPSKSAHIQQNLCQSIKHLSEISERQKAEGLALQHLGPADSQMQQTQTFLTRHNIGIDL